MGGRFGCVLVEMYSNISYLLAKMAKRLQTLMLSQV